MRLPVAAKIALHSESATASSRPRAASPDPRSPVEPRATPGFGDAVTSGTARAGISADTIMDVIAGSAWYAVCVRRIKDVDSAAKELTKLVLRGVLATRPDRGR